MIINFFDKNEIKKLNEYIEINGRDDKIINLENNILNYGTSSDILFFAKEIKNADIESLQNKIIEKNEPDYIYFFARDIENADKKLLQDILLNMNLKTEDIWYCYLFARFVKGADKDKLQEKVIKYGNSETINAYIKWVDGANLDLLFKALSNVTNLEKKKNTINKNSKFWKYAEKFSKVGAKLLISKNKTFSKIGGFPDVDENFVWPEIGSKKLPFFMQLDFSEINANGKLINFPKYGYLYIFIDEDGVNRCLENSYKFIFVDYLEKDKIKEHYEDVKIYSKKYLKVKQIKSFPFYEEDKQLSMLFQKLNENEQDYYLENCCFQDIKYGILGGWPQILQSSYLPNGYMQLLEIESIDNYAIWGDLGILQFYAKEEDVKNCNFTNIQMNIETT